MDGKQNTALSYTAVIALGFVFRDTHTDQGSNESADGATRTYAGERRHDRSGRNKWAETRNCERPYANEKAKRAADGSTSTCSRRDALRSLGVLLVRKVFGSLVAGEQYGNVLVPESGCEQGDNSLLDLSPLGIEAECCRVLSCHMDVSFTFWSTSQANVIFRSLMGGGLTGGGAANEVKANYNPDVSDEATKVED